MLRIAGLDCTLRCHEGGGNERIRGDKKSSGSLRDSMKHGSSTIVAFLRCQFSCDALTHPNHFFLEKREEISGGDVLPYLSVCALYQYN